MESARHRHDLSDHVWSPQETRRAKGIGGGIAQDNCRFLNAVFKILRAGAPLFALPPDYGD